MKLNTARLNSIAITLEDIDKIDEALKWYEGDKSGPAYMTVSPPAGGSKSIALQFDREHFRAFMTQQKQDLIRHLEERFDGFEYDPEASWIGDKKEVDTAE